MIGIENNLGLWALAALVPFIIIYLRSPKPIDMTVPSLMFLMKDKGVNKKVSFLRKLIRNIVFYLQLLAIVFLALTIAVPFITLAYSYSSENTAIIIDSSASMQTNNRFQQALSHARSNLKGRITIIEAIQNPRPLLERGSQSEAQKVLTTLTPKDTTTNIGDALLLANDLLQGKKARVLVLSDFINSNGADIFLAKRTLESSDKEVEFIDLSDDASNIAIIDLEITKEDSRVFIKNYDDENKDITVEIYKDNSKVASQKLTLAPNSIDSFLFNTPAGISEVRILSGDDFPGDNKAIISLPLQKKVSALLITNQKNSHLQAALQASPDIQLQIAAPPVIPSLTHDIVIMQNVDKNLILPGTFQDIRSFIRKDGAFVMAAQENMPNTLDILPVKLSTVTERPTKACVAIYDSLFPPDEFTQDPCFITINKFIALSTDNTSAVRLEESNTKTPILIEKNKVVFYNILDAHSDFKSLSQYPIFWNNIVNHLVKPQTVSELNHRTGDILIFREQQVTTPTRKQKASRLVLDEAGIYSFNGKKVAANLLSDLESDVSHNNKLTERSQDFESADLVSQANFNLEIPILILILIILLLELVIVKLRGDF